MTRGAVAAGSPLTVEAGLRALRLGGNAVDAAVAASLMAGVAEPLLTGLGGAGLATVRAGAQVRVLDLFTAMPGLEREGPPPPVDELAVDFGVTKQIFHTGPGAVAVPGMPRGLWELHRAHGSLELSELVRPAVDAARAGVEVSPVFETVASLLWPILTLDPEVRARFGPHGRPPRAGETFAWPALGDTLAAYGREGPALFERGLVGERLFETFGALTRLSPADLRAWRPCWSPALRVPYREATVWLPGPPSVAGLLVAAALRALEGEGSLPAELAGSARALRLAEAQRAAERFREDGLAKRLFDPSFLDAALNHLGADRRGSGFTTHISTIDERGDAVAITHSLGETCGRAVPGTGILLNNFLGEADVNPPEAPRLPGERLYTMCCPALLLRGERLVALGTGGSNRIRSAILQGVSALVDHDLSPAEAVAAPRVHVERGVLHLEAGGRPAEAVRAVREAEPDAVIFEDRHLFFGGLHMVESDGTRFAGAGDARRSGAWGRA